MTPSTTPTREAVADALRTSGTIAGAARALGVDRRRLSERVNADAELRALTRAPRVSRKRTGERPAGVRRNGDEAEVTGRPSTFHETPEALMRSMGLDPAEWVVVSSTPNQWEGPLAGGGVTVYRQLKLHLRRRPSPGEMLAPARPVLRSRRARPGRRSRTRPWVAVVEGDHQAPYHDPILHRASLAFLAELQPDRHVFLGDTADFPTISRHADHPAASATPQECVDAAGALLEDKANAAPNAKREKLKGNHDWRVEGELLARSERMYGIKPYGQEIAALSIRNLLGLDGLGVGLVEDPRGWEHGEVELVPGPKGLVVRHGWLTGANTAGRSLAKRGRSIIVGHGHGREMVYAWDPAVEVERVAAMVGTMSLARSKRFPHFAVCDDWLQGFGVVTVWPEGHFEFEHVRYVDGRLRWRGQTWRG